MAASGNRWQLFFNELKRRRVFRVATLYIVAFWPIIQLVDIASPALELPDSIMRYAIVAFLSGFPIALILAWIFDINQDGITVTESAASSDNPLIGKRSEIWGVAALLVIVAGLFVVQLKQEDFTGSASSADKTSIAVLPFQPFSTEPSDQHFADGLTEELLNVLAHVKSLRVAARTSSFAYKGVNKDVREIGKELDVGVILEGSVRRNDIDNTIRVTAQLVDAETGDHYFSKTYDRPFSDLFAIQDDIANSVVEELHVTLLGTEREKLQARATADPEAIVAHSLGQSELAKRNEQSFVDAIRFFEKAIELDPEYIDAHVGIATAQALLVSYGFAEKEEYLPLAQERIDRAMTLDPESGNAWATQGLIHMQSDNSDKTREALEKAIELSPSHAMAHMWYAGQISSLDEQLAWYKKAYELDPRSPVIGLNIAIIHLAQGNELEAMKMYSQIVESDPYYHGAYSLASNIAQSRGRLDEALNQMIRAYELSPSNDYVMQVAGIYSDLGESENTHAWLAKIDEESLGDTFRAFYDWLLIATYLLEENQEESLKLLSKKIDAAQSDSIEFYFEDAATAALFLRDYDEVIRSFEKIESEVSLSHLNNSNRIDAMLAAAYVYGLRNDLEKRDSVLDSLESLITEFSETQPDNGHFLSILRGQMESIRGNQRLALFHLQRAIDEGFRRHIIIRHLPTLDPLREEPGFQTMLASLESRMSLLREQRAIASSFGSDW